ncbi:MAG: IGHMBP2 family helicase [Candidatus Nanohaloarchaea archaeon]
MRKVLLTGLDGEGPGDIVGAVAGETDVNPDLLGEIQIDDDTAFVEVQDRAEDVARGLDGETVGRSEVSASLLEDEDLEEMEEISNYVEKYRNLVEMEREEEMRRHEESIRNLSGREREDRGKAILHMRGRDEGEGLEGHLVKFMRNRKGEELPETEITVGDLVMLSKNDPLRDDNPTGTVVEKTRYSVTVAFDENPPGFVYDRGLRMDLYVNDITYQRMKDALSELKSADGRLEELRDVVAGLKEPGEPEPAEVDSWHNEKLNESQRNAVRRALGAEDFHLIHGPPGTGKTTTAIEVIQQYIDRGKTVLATADSNAAVDNILEFLLDQGVDAVRVGHPARVTPQLREHTLDSLVEENEKYRESQEVREKAFELKDRQDDLTHPSGRYRRGMSNEKIKELADQGRGSRGVPAEKIEEMAEWLEIQEEADELFEKSDRLEEEAVQEVIESMDVVCTTNSTAGSELMEDREFDVLVIDEATQATEPSCLIPITHADEVVMAGDHRQLPPTVKNQEAAEKGLEDTLFERLAEDHLEIKDMLEVQYRMHRKIMDFSSEHFYGGKLRADSSVEDHTLADLDYDGDRPDSWDEALSPEHPAVFLDTSKIDASERTRQGSTSKENRREAKIVQEITEEVLDAGIHDEDVAVISPYDDQVDLLDRRIDREDLEVKTVDGFQGREKEVVIISLVRSNERDEIGFLRDVRRLNVALTRAKRKLVVVGDSDTVSTHDTYSQLLEYMEDKGKLLELDD